jgi:cysteine desulfurase/selenocysteine lyase
MAIGIVYVKQENFEILRPTLLGAWNVHSPDYITQEKINFHPTARRYEPGVLNASGIVGFKAALELIDEFGMENISSQLLKLKSHLINKLESLGFSINGPRIGPNTSSITTFKPSEGNALAIFDKLNKAGIICSCRKDRSGEQFLRFSPHFYNTETEIDRTIEILTLGTNS